MKHKFLVFQHFADKFDKTDKNNELYFLCHYVTEKELQMQIKNAEQFVSTFNQDYHYIKPISIIPAWAIQLLDKYGNCLLLNKNKQYVEKDGYRPFVYGTDFKPFNKVYEFEWIDEELHNLKYKKIKYINSTGTDTFDRHDDYIVTVGGRKNG